MRDTLGGSVLFSETCWEGVYCLVRYVGRECTV